MMTTGLESTARAATTRERVVDTAVRLTVQLGWSHVTMGRLAQAVGVSRQTVYNEIGTKSGLAEAMIAAELDRFMSVVSVAFDAHPDDLIEAIRTAARTVLEHAYENSLLHAIVSATHGADTELLPLLTTQSESLLFVAKGVIRARIEPFHLDLAREEQDAVIDMVVRIVLSHIMQPSGSPAATADSIAWIAGRALR